DGERRARVTWLPGDAAATARGVARYCDVDQRRGVRAEKDRQPAAIACRRVAGDGAVRCGDKGVSYHATAEIGHVPGDGRAEQVQARPREHAAAVVRPRHIVPHNTVNKCPPPRTVRSNAPADTPRVLGHDAALEYEIAVHNRDAGPGVEQFSV